MTYARFTLLAAVMALLGCQGQVAAGDDGGADGAAADGSDAGVIADSAPTDAGRFACPLSPPELGTACDPYWRAPDGGDGPIVVPTCEYGQDPNLGCNDLYVCQDGGTWARGSAPVPVSDASCPTPPNDAKCAADFASVPRGEACNQADPALCTYPEGFCGCATVGKAIDGGSVMVWSCEAPGTGCPVPRPKVGSACTVPEDVCVYWGCGLETGARLYCGGGTWFSLEDNTPPLPPNCP